MTLFTLPGPGMEVPGWFGKLPGMGDFGQRRLPPHFRAVWDEWLQTGLQTLRVEREDWVSDYLHAPIWYFALGEGVMSQAPWIGVLMPSVDSVGRYFPLTLAIELVCGNQASVERQMAHIHQWWQRSAKAGLAALDSNMGAEQFDGHLQKQFGDPSDAEMIETSMLALPPAGMSSWYVDAGLSQTVVETVSNLPDAAGFSVLFGATDLSIDSQNPQ
jgi:type VI secretion system protein ImpM